MEIQVKIYDVLAPQSFVSKKDGGEVKKYSFLGRTNEQYPKTICFTCMGDEMWARLGISSGKTYNLGINISSREWNGRWFTEVSCWKATCLDEQPQQMPPQQPSVVPNAQPFVESQAPQNDDLPF